MWCGPIAKVQSVGDPVRDLPITKEKKSRCKRYEISPSICIFFAPLVLQLPGPGPAHRRPGGSLVDTARDVPVSLLSRLPATTAAASLLMLMVLLALLILLILLTLRILRSCRGVVRKPTVIAVFAVSLLIKDAQHAVFGVGIVLLLILL